MHPWIDEDTRCEALAHLETETKAAYEAVDTRISDVPQVAIELLEQAQGAVHGTDFGSGATAHGLGEHCRRNAPLLVEALPLIFRPSVGDTLEGQS